MSFCEDDMYPSARLPGDFVGGILYQLEKLSITISALGDTALAIGVLGHEAGVHGVSLQDAGRLLENGFDHR
ncbi:hypothetical protein ABZ946_19195 [Streptomyces sp. NPDC046324]|uniref:hypothetical protein n=1 Tax=Streptomyces sp. NPDC046324 TaxID=3154915 RepID=UPI0034016894